MYTIANAGYQRVRALGHRRYHGDKRFDKFDQQWSSGHFEGTSADYDDLFIYFVSGFLSYRDRYLSRSYYPGEPSYHGLDVDGLEGFARVLPMVAAWLGSGRKPEISSLFHGNVNLADDFRKGLIAGTNPRSGGYWGKAPKFNQRVVEAALIALSLYLGADALWRPLTRIEKDNLANWLYTAGTVEVPSNNWLLFSVLINLVLRHLGVKYSQDVIDSRYLLFKSFYLGGGWFSDGPAEQHLVDYYNVWCIHVVLSVVSLIDPQFDERFLKSARIEFLSSFKYLLGPAGFPIMGRSVCYRLSVCAPLILGSVLSPQVIAPGLARRSLDAIWAHFLNQGVLRRGVLTQGFYGTDLRFLDNYSGPASSLWSLLSLATAFAQPEQSLFWTGNPGLLPVEEESYEIDLPEIGWRIIGDKTTSSIALRQLRVTQEQAVVPTPVSRFAHLGLLWGNQLRPENRQTKYNLKEYRSDNPISGINTPK